MFSHPATDPVRLTDAMRSVFVELLVHGPLSRAEVARRLALSPSALTKLTRPLIEAGYLLEATGEDGPATVGRPSQPLQVDASRMSFVGIKLTEDELFAVRTDLSATVHGETSRPLADHGIEHVLGRIVEAVEELTVPERPLSAVGISLAGTATPSDPVVHTSPFLGWSQLPLAELVERAVHVPTVLDNDVRALTAVQQWFGAGVGHSSFALVTVGAGLGCGLVIGDRLVTGRSGATGLVGHLQIDDRGPLCERGHRGCARAYASSPPSAARSPPRSTGPSSPSTTAWRWRPTATPSPAACSTRPAPRSARSSPPSPTSPGRSSSSCPASRSTCTRCARTRSTPPSPPTRTGRPAPYGSPSSPSPSTSGPGERPSPLSSICCCTAERTAGGH
ncbi:ROK family protein [Nonomuraea rubra]|uniref:ROK family protein n=1 Tax=Nonomuraea rubra TaxID=46180 RepID=UPI00360DDCF3